MTADSNAYSDSWYTTFLDSMPEASTQQEVAFIERHLPLQRFSHLLDLCCGAGRHAGALAEKGYRVLGVDVNERAVRLAQRRYPQVRFQAGDMRDLAALQQTFDGVLNLWHSFGYYDDVTNQDILRQVHDVLRPGARALFDIYNRDHMMRRPPLEVGERAGKTVRTSHSWRGNRHRVVLEYDGQRQDTFEWRLYTPTEFEAICAEAGLRLLLKCAWFDPSLAPAYEHARMQFLLERPF